MKKLFIILLIVMYVLKLPHCFAQQNKIDSLISIIKTDKADTNKLIHLYKLCVKYVQTENYNNGLKYGNEALLLSNSLVNKHGYISEIVCL